MLSKNLSLEEYQCILLHYEEALPKNIHKMKRRANELIHKRMCVSYNDNKCKKYSKIINIIRNRNLRSYNKKNLRHYTIKSKFRGFKNNTRTYSPIRYYLCI